MTHLELIPLVVVGLATVVAAATDLWKFKVYNLLTLPTLALGLVASTALGGWAGLGASLLGAGFGFAILFVFFALGGVGAGDVKLLTAVGAWLGPYWTVHVFIASALAAGAYAVALLLARGGVLAVAVEVASARQAIFNPAAIGRPATDMAAEVQRPDRRRRLVPYAAMICIGYFLIVAWWHARLVQVWPPYPTRSESLAARAIVDDRAPGRLNPSGPVLARVEQAR